MKTVQGKLWQYMFSVDWCVKCGAITEHDNIATHMPGINAKRCVVCGSGTQVNYLDEPSSTRIPDDCTVIPENFCPYCKKETNFVDHAVNHDHILFEGKRCTTCQSFVVDLGNEFVFKVAGEGTFGVTYDEMA